MTVPPANKHTHIKKTGVESKDVWRAHFGKEIAKEVFRRLQAKEMKAIYRSRFNKLDPEDKAECERLAEEAGENLSALDAGTLDKTAGDVVSTQFFKTELNRALAAEQEGKSDSVANFKSGLSSVTKRAAVQSRLAVTVALEKSDRDGTKEERNRAFDELKGKSRTTWNAVPGVSELNVID